MALGRFDRARTARPQRRQTSGADSNGVAINGTRTKTANPKLKIDKGRQAIGEDASRMVGEYSPGKKGGEFLLPFGGRLLVPSGACAKKDVISVCTVSPSDRSKYLPPFSPEDKLLSDPYLVAASNPFRRSLKLILQYHNADFELTQLKVLFKATDSEEWVTRSSIQSDSGRFVTVECDTSGIFIILSTPKEERFDIPVQGCLYNARICKQISLRFPKKTTDTELIGKVKITPLNRESLLNLRTDYPNDLNDLICATDFFDIRPNIQKEFKRNLTVKLPLPTDLVEDEDYPQEDVTLLHETQEGWNVLDVAMKFTKNSLSFDTRSLSRYCVALAKPNRKRRLPIAFRHIQDQNRVVRGDFIPFLHFQEKVWTLWIDCCRTDAMETVINRRLKQGFKQLNLSEFSVTEAPPDDSKVILSRQTWRKKKTSVEKVDKPIRSDLDLHNGKEFVIEIGGDLQLCDDEVTETTNLNLVYHENLPECYRRFIVQPLPVITYQNLQNGKSITATIRIMHSNEDGAPLATCLRQFELTVDKATAEAYLYVEPEPEPPPMHIEIEVPMEVDSPPPPPSPTFERARPPPSASFMRLTTLIKPPRIVVKESRVLTGRSLMALAREVEHGLTLAIYLNISDSTITGMGFDALASGCNLTDITYRILLLWKRRSSRQKQKQVDQLAAALTDMGRLDLADVVLRKHEENVELSPDCFHELRAE